MLPLEHPGRMQIAFDDHRLVNNAGLLLPATLAQRVGLRELVDRGRTSSVLGCMVKAPSTLGTFLRSFRWGHVRQLDRVSRELMARAWAAGGGPGDGPLTIDLDSTICETYGLAKEGARHHGYTGKRGYYPLLAVAAGTGDVLMSRLREGLANTARGAAHFLRETVGRVRHAWASGPLTVRADSGFYNPFHRRKHIEAIPEANWTPIPYWMEGAADVAEAEYTPVRTEPDAAPVRLIVRRVKPTHGSQLALFASHSYRECHPEPEVRRGSQPSSLGPLRRQRRLAVHPGDGPQPGPLDRTHRSGRAGGNHKDPPQALLLPGRTHHPLGPPPQPSSPTGLAPGIPVQQRSGPVANPATPLLTAALPSDPSPDNLTAPQAGTGGAARVYCCHLPDDLALLHHLGPSEIPFP